MDLIDETAALKLVSSVRDLRAEETLKRKLKLSSLENQIEDEKEIEEMATDISLTNIPHQGAISLNALNGHQVLKHTHSAMEVLTPIQSSKVEEKKKENMSAINLAEFESYSTNPFEEMELKTLNDKEELAMLLQPSSQLSYGLQYQNLNPMVLAWPDRVPPTYQPIQQYNKTADWMTSEAMFSNNDKAFGNINTATQEHNQTISRGILRQAKSVPDLSDGNYSIGGTPVSHLASVAGPTSPNKRLSSRTPPPRLTSESITRPTPKPALNLHQCIWEKSLNPAEKRLVQQLQDMGFLRERSARAISRLGANEKDVVDHLLMIQKFEDFGHSIERIETALDVLKPCQELPKLLEQHLALVDQLSALGFDQRKISSALVVAGHDRDKALDILLMK